MRGRLPIYQRLRPQGRRDGAQRQGLGPRVVARFREGVQGEHTHRFRVVTGGCGDQPRAYGFIPDFARELLDGENTHAHRWVQQAAADEFRTRGGYRDTEVAGRDGAYTPVGVSQSTFHQLDRDGTRLSESGQRQPPHPRRLHSKALSHAIEERQARQAPFCALA